MKIDKLLNKAVEGDAEARRELHERVGNATVFVAPQGKIDVEATLEAIEYWRKYGTAPKEWGDRPTCRFGDAFSDMVRRDPLHHFRPVTPGTMNDLWEYTATIDDESVSGHKLVAALAYGLAHRMISGSALEIKVKIAQLLEGRSYPALAEAYRQMRDEPSGAGRERVMKQVLSPFHPIAPVDSPPRRSGLASPFDQRGQTVGVQVNVAAQSWTANGKGALREALVAGFGISGIKDICFEMNIDYENFPSTKSALARSLVQYCERFGRLDELGCLVHAANPAVW